MKNISIVIPLAPDRRLDIKDSLLKDKNKIHLIVEKGANPSRNRNKGIKKAKTEFIAFLNAHSILTENWPEKVKEFFEAHPEIDIVGGPQLTSKNDPFFERASGYALSSIFGAAEASTRYRIKKLNLEANEKHLTSANLICREKVFKKIKFDENLWPGEDPKFISDAINAGFNVAYSPDIIIYHKRRPTFRALSKQIFNYGFTRTRKEKFGETLKKPAFLVPSMFVIYLVILPTLMVFNLIFLFPVIIYIILSIIFSLYEGIKNKDFKIIFILPFIFLTLHITYGVGFIYGLIVEKNG